MLFEFLIGIFGPIFKTLTHCQVNISDFANQLISDLSAKMLILSILYWQAKDIRFQPKIFLRIYISFGVEYKYIAYEGK